MAITKQPADDSFYSAYSQISVETDDSTSGLEIETQNFDEANMISLNIVDSGKVEVIDNSSGTATHFYKAFPIFRKAVAGEWYAFRVDSITSNTKLTAVSVALYQGTASGVVIEGAQIAATNLAIGHPMSWRFQVRTDLAITGPTTVLLVYAGIRGLTAGVRITLNRMRLAYGQNFIAYSPSSVMAANSLTESIDIHRDSGFGTTKKYDLSFLAKAGFRDDRLRTFPYQNPDIGFAIDYSLISAYAYRDIRERNFNVRYASRGVRPRGYNVNFSRSNIGLALTDRTPDSDRNLYVKKYYGYPYFVTLFPKGASELNNATSVVVQVKSSGGMPKTQFDISSRLNIPLVYEFDDEISGGADYVNLSPFGGAYPHQAWNIIFVDTEVPCNPFYIRWINQKGGWDTYMFEQHKKYTQEVDRGDRYVLANARDPYTSETRGELAPEFKSIVQAGAEQLDENDFNLLKGIALSPLVQQYHYRIGAWQRVLVNDTDLTWDTRAPRNTVSYEFQLIDEQTQW